MATLFTNSTALSPRLRSANPSRESTVYLKANQAYSFKNGSQAVKITALAGNMWVTQNGEDYVLQAGEAFTLTGRGKVVMEGLPEGMARLSAG